MPAPHPSRRMTILGVALCAIVAAYLLLGVAYALVYYDDFASANPQFLRYVVVPGALAAVLLAAAAMGTRWSVPIGIYSLSALAGLFLFEGFLTARQIPVWFGMLGRLGGAQQATVDASSGIVRGFTLRSLNNRVGQDRLDEAMLSGFPAAEVILCTPGDEVVSYKADRYGFNNADEVYDGPVDTVLLGDSFVEGFCLPPGDDVASQMRKRGVATAGLGIRGNGPLMELASLGRFGPLLRPRNVVLVFYEGNDWENLAKELTDPWLRSALETNADFGSQASSTRTRETARAEMNHFNSKPVTLADVVMRHTTLRNFFALQQTGASLGIAYSKVPHEIPEFALALRRAKSIVSGWNGRLSLLYVPQIDRFIGAFPVDRALDQFRRLVLDTATHEAVDVVDLTEALRQLPEPARMYGAEAHFSRDGARFVADLLTNAEIADHESNSSIRPLQR